MFTRLWLLITFVTLAACGGGGGGGGSNPPPAPAPSGLSYSPAASTFIVGFSINPLTPTVSGTVTTYSVNPALPLGLSMNSSTGVISGTPTLAVAAASYVVTATNLSGSAATNVSIAVTDVAPAISYESTQLTLTTGVTFTMGVMNSGGPVTTWSVTPALPDGLALNITNGTITGAPRVTSDTTRYTVAAQNSGGVDFFDLNIRIDSGVLLDLGHAAEIKQIRHDGDRVLSMDIGGHWALWNATTAARIASGDLNCFSNSPCMPRIELAGGIAVVAAGTTVLVRSASDGRILFTLPSASWWQLASDGSYITAGSDQGLTAWSPTGTLRFSRGGNYSQANAYAAATEVRVANGALGVNVIEKVTVPTGTITTGTFLGTFHSWFLDGERFLTNVSGTVRVYGHDSQLQDTKVLAALNNLTGQGNRFWVRGNDQLSVYEIGAGTSPIATFAVDDVSVTAIPSRMAIGLLSIGSTFSIIDLASATPSKVDITSTLSSPKTFAARSDSGSLLGYFDGLVVDATGLPASSKYFGFGIVRDVVANDDRIVVALTHHPIMIFNATTRELEGQIDVRSMAVELSSDGSVLAAHTADGLQIFSLPSGAEIERLSNAPSGLAYFTLSGSGQVVGRLLLTNTQSTYRREIVAVGGATLWSENTCCHTNPRGLDVYVSPSGTRAAAPKGLRTGTSTLLIANGTPVFEVPGMALGWIDEDRILLNRYSDNFEYVASDIVSPAGQVLRTLRTAAEIRALRPVDANRIYSPERNQILSLDDGSPVWSTENDTLGVGAVTASHVVFTSGATIRMEPY